MNRSKKLCHCGRGVYAKSLCALHYRDSRPQKKRVPIKPVSSKRKKDNETYSILRKQFLLENPLCGVCGKPATEIHHKAKRGANFLNVSTWLAVDRECHVLIESNAKWAVENGYTLSQEQIRKLREQ